MLKSESMQQIRTGLRRIMCDFLKTQPPEEAPILAWPVVCGADVASRTQAVEFADGRLTVEVIDAAWCAQLTALVPRYLSSLDELLPNVVKEVRLQTKKR